MKHQSLFDTKPIVYLIDVTDRQQQTICKLIEKQCANYDDLYEYANCVVRDLRCYMMGTHYDGWLCPYFEKCVLPLDSKLMNVFFPQEMKSCKWCGKPFVTNKNKGHCSEKCADESKKKAHSLRMRKHRGKM